MLKKILVVTVLALAPVVTLAGDGKAILGAAIGAAAGTAIGSEVGGRNGAIVGGGLGGATGAALGSKKTPARVEERRVVVREYDDEDEYHGKHGHKHHHDNGRRGHGD